jgi:NAD(P)-dependent dehydrogenase (short-subunit alcohol dehydrogenase family)
MSQIVIVTGASRGIGAATARLLGREKAAVVVNYRNAKTEADAVVNDIKASGGEAVAVQGDVGNEDDVLRLFAETDRAFGPLTGLVNNAGITGGTKRRIEALTFAGIMETMRVNVAGQLLCAREAVKRMSTKYGGKGGAIVNVSSGASRLGSPNEYVDYAASKGALDTMTTGLAKEVAQEGIRVNAVRAGHVYTGLHASGGEPDRVERVKHLVAMKRGGQPEEIARAILWLLSDEASFTTGAFLDVAGGN